MQKQILFLVALFTFFITPSYTQITKSLDGSALPLWEAGAGFVAANVPAYPGSEDSNNFFIPIPTFFYRGEIIRADEEGGMRGRFLKTDDFEINLSIGGSLPASSKDVAARAGMPNLKTMVELGPGLLATLWRKRGIQSYKLGLNIPLRAAFTVDFFEAKERGLVFNPLLYFITENLVGKRVFTFTSLSSIVTSHKFQKVFYQVDPQFALPTRPAYAVESGYLGSTLSQGFSKLLFNEINAFIGVNWTNLRGASNQNSPLFKRKDNFSAAIGFVWWFYESGPREKS
ncbi:MAG: MipA/OmpV family protein [Bacteriovoracaceae bacterium]|nr:MipA/OmpV family protein [Bacteriovoracaceae bacterium]